jgi:hypothetical protein
MSQRIEDDNAQEARSAVHTTAPEPALLQKRRVSASREGRTVDASTACYHDEIPTNTKLRCDAACTTIPALPRYGIVHCSASAGHVSDVPG